MGRVKRSETIDGLFFLFRGASHEVSGCSKMLRTVVPVNALQHLNGYSEVTRRIPQRHAVLEAPRDGGVPKSVDDDIL